LNYSVASVVISGYVDEAVQYSLIVDPFATSATSFSPSVVPEPTTTAVFVGGVMALLGSKRRLKR
jgi:hypothetical protein